MSNYPDRVAHIEQIVKELQKHTKQWKEDEEYRTVIKHNPSVLIALMYGDEFSFDFSHDVINLNKLITLLVDTNKITNTLRGQPEAGFNGDYVAFLVKRMLLYKLAGTKDIVRKIETSVVKTK